MIVFVPRTNQEVMFLLRRLEELGVFWYSGVTPLFRYEEYMPYTNTWIGINPRPDSRKWITKNDLSSRERAILVSGQRLANQLTLPEIWRLTNKGGILNP